MEGERGGGFWGRVRGLWGGSEEWMRRDGLGLEEEVEETKGFVGGGGGGGRRWWSEVRAGEVELRALAWIVDMYNIFFLYTFCLALWG